MVFAACLSVVAECLFFFYSHRADNRFINGIVGTYEVSRSYHCKSYYFCVFYIPILAIFNEEILRNNAKDVWSSSIQ